MFGSKSKRNLENISNYWITSPDNFCMSPLEFYTAVENAFQKIKVPGLKIDREEIAEGGLLSDKRIYLRLMRERLAFYICAAPFGTRYFISCRSVYVPPVVKFWHVAAVLAVVGIAFLTLAHLLDAVFVVLAMFSLILATILGFRNVLALKLQNVDALLLEIPVISPIYQLYFRKVTYYRIDTRNVYLETIPKVLRELVDDVTGAKGIKLVRMQSPHVKSIEQIILRTGKLQQ
jgi:hypothetical protein